MILSVKGKGGKRATRFYPHCYKALNRQAQKTQQWQMKYLCNYSANLIQNTLDTFFCNILPN